MKPALHVVAVCCPLRTLTVGSFWRESADRVACRVPARRPGNFHLRGQMKVTKAKALNATPFARSARAGSPVRRATWKECGTADLQRSRRRGPRKASPARIRWTQGQSEARPRRANSYFDAPGRLQVARRAGPAKREERTERFCIEPLCFGDFHLGPQMKVTRPPGRDPAGWHAADTANKRKFANVRNGPRADTCGARSLYASQLTTNALAPRR